jgi:hypothetical protein
MKVCCRRGYGIEIGRPEIHICNTAKVIQNIKNEYKHKHEYDGRSRPVTTATTEA